MKKKAIKNIAKALPSFFKNAAGYLKNNFDENGKEILGNATGTAALVVRLFSQPLIDQYFDKLTDKKLEDFGFNIYLKTSLLQAKDSLIIIDHKLDASLAPELVFRILENSIKKELDIFQASATLLIFQPKFHPVVVFVKKNYQRILGELGVSPTEIKSFLKHFNDNIESALAKEFGDDYQKHLDATEKYNLKENETAFLWDMVQLGKIGFKDSEDLKYETTYGKWEKVSNLRISKGDHFAEPESTKQDKDIQPVENLIDEYFSQNPKNHLQEILFMIADFGKGKSIFLKHYASELRHIYKRERDIFQFILTSEVLKNIQANLY